MSDILKLMKKKRKKPRWMRTELDRIRQKQVWVFRIGVAIFSLQILLILYAIAMGIDIPWIWVVLMGGW